MTNLETILDLKSRISQDIIGQKDILEKILIGLLANGHLLVEGLPGLAKTRAVKSLAKNLETDFSRIQFTPDLLPADVTGTEVLNTEDVTDMFQFRPGPIFGNIILADEINRAPAKVQAALLEAMEERQVTVASTTHKMPELFMVMATQNPIEQEGTYPLPEAQMDRFLMHVYIDYPLEESEVEIIRLVRGEKSSNRTSAASTPISQQVIFNARDEIANIHSTSEIEQYIVALIFATRYPERYDEELRKWIQVGASPRGGLGLDACSRAHAWLQGNSFVTPDNVRALAHEVLRHRIKLSYEAYAEGITTNQVIDRILELVAVP